MWIAVETWYFVILMSWAMIQGLKTLQTHLPQNIGHCRWRRPHKGHELHSRGCNEQSSRLYGRVHEWCLRLKSERWLRSGECEGAGSNDGFDLFNWGLYDVGKGLQLYQSILRNPSKEGTVRHFNINGTCGTYFAVEDLSVDVADSGSEDMGIGSETGKDIMGDERNVELGWQVDNSAVVVRLRHGNAWAADCWCQIMAPASSWPERCLAGSFLEKGGRTMPYSPYTGAEHKESACYVRSMAGKDKTRSAYDPINVQSVDVTLYITIF